MEESRHRPTPHPCGYETRSLESVRRRVATFEIQERARPAGVPQNRGRPTQRREAFHRHGRLAGWLYAPGWWGKLSGEVNCPLLKWPKFGVGRLPTDRVAAIASVLLNSCRPAKGSWKRRGTEAEAVAKANKRCDEIAARKSTNGRTKCTFETGRGIHISRELKEYVKWAMGRPSSWERRNPLETLWCSGEKHDLFVVEKYDAT